MEKMRLPFSAQELEQKIDDYVCALPDVEKADIPIGPFLDIAAAMTCAKRALR